MTAVRWRLVRALADLASGEPDPGENLERSVAFLGWPVDAATVVRAGDGAGVAVGAAVAVVGFLLVGPRPAVVAGGGAVGFGVAAAARHLPHLFATAARSRALGAAPSLVSRAVLRMRLSPSPETAAAFAAEAGSGRLAASLADHVDRAAGSGRSGLAAFADEWAAWFPALRRSLTLVESAGQAEAAERRRALDDAMAVTLDGARETAASFAESIRGPGTALYAFGVLLPLALVAMLPAAGTIGLQVPAVVIVAVYDVLLPAFLLAAGAWLVARRPVAFPPPAVSRSHPAVPSRQWPAALAGCLGAASAWIAAGALVGPWAGWLAAPGIGLGLALVVRYRPVTDVRDHVRDVEEGLPDALALVGREVQRGRAVEAALDDAADLLSAGTGDVLATAARRQRQLGVGVRESLLGDDGALATVPSRRASDAAELLSLAAAEGRPAGQALIATADHLEELARLEADVRRDLRRVTSTLANTAAVFGPLVGGTTITLARRLSGDEPLVGGLAPGTLGLAVGAYVLALAVILTALATGLERGLDRALVGHRVGRALVSATAVFIGALVATGYLV